jgi:replicative DNA helicase
MSDNRIAAAFDRLPPQNLDAEKGVLGSVLLVNDTIDEVTEFLVSEHFYSDTHRKIFAAIQHLYENGTRGIDAVTLAEELDRRGELAEIGGPAYIAEILDAVPHAAHARYYGRIVRDKAIQRSLIYACTDVLKGCYESNVDTDDLLEKAEQSIFRILEEQETTQKFAIGDILIDAFDKINERMEKEGSISGLPTGFMDLDEKTNGLQPTELIIIAARPSMGKTALVCNLAESAAETQGANGVRKGVLIFSLEQSKVELAERFLCIRARINGHRLRAGELDEVERHQLMTASSELSELPLFIDDQPGRSISQIAALSRRMKRQHNLGLVIIDYLQLIEPEDKRAPREQQVAQITRRLKFLAKELQIPVIALAQLNRGVETRKDGDKRPRMADLRESGSIEQDADLIMLLHRPEVYMVPGDPEYDQKKGVAEIIVAKNRSGPVGIVTLTWRSEFMRFENFSGLAMPEGGYAL